MPHTSAAAYIQTGKTTSADYSGGRNTPGSAKTVRYNPGQMCSQDDTSSSRAGIL